MAKFTKRDFDRFRRRTRSLTKKRARQWGAYVTRYITKGHEECPGCVNCGRGMSNR